MSNVLRILIALAILPAILLAACSSGARKKEGQPLQYADYAGAPIDGFHINTLQGWQAVGRNQVLVWNGPSEAYILTVWNNCNNLYFANVIALSSTSREVSLVEKVRVDDQVCPIQQIRPVNIKAMREDEAAIRKKAAGD